jgi:hypothetical protein
MTYSSYPQKSIKFIDKSDTVILSTTTIEEANEIFNEMDTMNLFKMIYCNNCEDRANAIAYILNKRNLTVAKFWLFGEGKISTGEDSYLLQSESCGTWGYHVAIGFLVNNGNKAETIIIDPGTQRRAVSLEDWALPLVQENKVGHVIMKDIAYYTYPVVDDKFQVDEIWTEKDPGFWRTARGLCGYVFLGPSKKKIRKKLSELMNTK